MFVAFPSMAFSFHHFPLHCIFVPFFHSNPTRCALPGVFPPLHLVTLQVELVHEMQWIVKSITRSCVLSMVLVPMNF